jgi:hypothetical protein
MDDARIAKLPVWAQDLLRDKDNEIRALQCELVARDEPDAGSSVHVLYRGRNADSTMPLPDDAVVGFGGRASTGNPHFMVRLLSDNNGGVGEAGDLEVQTAGAYVSLLPQVANTIIVRRVR